MHDVAAMSLGKRSSRSSAGVRTSFPSFLLTVAALGTAIGACSSESSESPETLVVAGEPSPPPPREVEPAVQPTVVPTDASVSPIKPSCLEKLDAAGIGYAPAVARGVQDAVVVKTAIGGVRFTKGNSDELTEDPMACSFVLTLERFATYLKSKGVVRVGTLGSYCYRCCCSWSPTNDCRSPTDPEPSCGDNGYSNHSWGRAIDVRYLKFQSGVDYDINNAAQWIEGAASSTCTTGRAKQTGVSKILYGLVCDVAAQGIFEAILTPNYNDAHRNHWHMDTGKPDEAPSGSTTVKSLATAPTPIDQPLESGAVDTCGRGGDPASSSGSP